MASDKLFVVAIDFGTTYSGYAFSTISNKSNIYTYNWSTGITQVPKTPTSILFTPRRDFDSFGHDAEEKYASLSRYGENKDWYFFKRFKLTLYRNKNLNESTTIKDYTGKEMPAIKVFSAGIQFLKDHLFNHFQERIQYMRESDIHWVLTLPAIWDETAKKLMRKSAEMAGIQADMLTLALEPESAALYCQLGEKITGLKPLEPGEKFLLLDCGGGTVDVTVHEIRQDKTLKEIHRASGGTWGGIKVDDAFQEHLLEMFDYELIEKLPKNEVLELEKSFESLKKRANTIDTSYTMQIPLILRQHAERGMLVAGKLKLEARVVRGFFNGPVQNICDHIAKIFRDLCFHDVHTIILVGGFAESKILQSDIQRQFPTKRIISPARPSTAVVSGAVEFGHCPERISQRKSPYTYDVKSVTTFIYVYHPLAKKKFIEGKEYCDDIFSIHVKKDQLVETGAEISNMTYETLYPSQSRMSFKVYVADSTSPKYIDDRGCRTIGSFEVCLPAMLDDDEKSVNVRMIFSGTELNVVATNPYVGKLSTPFRFVDHV